MADYETQPYRNQCIKMTVIVLSEDSKAWRKYYTIYTSRNKKCMT